MDKSLQIINQLGIKIAQLEVTNTELMIDLQNLQAAQQAPILADEEEANYDESST